MSLKPSRKDKKAHKMPETVRERATKQQDTNRQVKKNGVSSKIVRPLSTLRKVGQKEYNPVKVPQNKRWGKILGKRFNLLPTAIVNAWHELGRVSWPSRKDALKLTLAVVVFAVVFAIFVQLFGFGFERLMKFILST